jgi:hypothetical protein
MSLPVFAHPVKGLDVTLLRGFFLVRKRTILTKRPQLVGEVSANFSG